jgi:hypothetical protein
MPQSSNLIYVPKAPILNVVTAIKRVKLEGSTLNLPSTDGASYLAFCNNDNNQLSFGMTRPATWPFYHTEIDKILLPNSDNLHLVWDFSITVEFSPEGTGTRSVSISEVILDTTTTPYTLVRDTAVFAVREEAERSGKTIVTKQFDRIKRVIRKESNRVNAYRINIQQNSGITLGIGTILFDITARSAE